MKLTRRQLRRLIETFIQKTGLPPVEAQEYINVRGERDVDLIPDDELSPENKAKLKKGIIYKDDEVRNQMQALHQTFTEDPILDAAYDIPMGDRARSQSPTAIDPVITKKVHYRVGYNLVYQMMDGPDGQYYKDVADEFMTEVLGTGTPADVERFVNLYATDFPRGISLVGHSQLKDDIRDPAIAEKYYKLNPRYDLLKRASSIKSKDLFDLHDDEYMQVVEDISDEWFRTGGIYTNTSVLADEYVRGQMNALKDFYHDHVAKSGIQ